MDIEIISIIIRCTMTLSRGFLKTKGYKFTNLAYRSTTGIYMHLLYYIYMYTQNTFLYGIVVAKVSNSLKVDFLGCQNRQTVT